MKHLLLPVTVVLAMLASTVFLFSCRSSQELPGRITCRDLPTDSAVSSLLGDTVCNVLYAPSVVYAYKMRPQKTENDTLIAGHAIDYPIGELDASCYSVLQFFLKDSNNYVWTNEKVKTPFSPNIGFEFTGEKQRKIFLLLAFNGYQLAIATQDQVLLHRQFKNEHYLLRFAWSLLPDNKYIKNLLDASK